MMEQEVEIRGAHLPKIAEGGVASLRPDGLMWMGKGTFQKVKDTKQGVQNSAKPHSPTFSGLRFRLGGRRRRRASTRLVRYSPH